MRSNAYDPLNRVITQTDPQSFTVGYAYNPADSLTALTDSRSLVTGREVDGFGEVIQEIFPYMTRAETTWTIAKITATVASQAFTVPGLENPMTSTATPVGECSRP